MPLCRWRLDRSHGRVKGQRGQRREMKEGPSPEKRPPAVRLFTHVQFI